MLKFLLKFNRPAAKRLVKTPSLAFDGRGKPLKAAFPAFTVPKKYVPYAQLAALSLVGYSLWWYYYPHNPFPKSVAKLLRNGLWQERKFQDYETGLRFFIDALEECKRLEMDPLSDGYTGIEIKIAEMYEKLNLKQRANTVYFDILKRIDTALKQNTVESEQKRGELIKRDLSCIVKVFENQEGCTKEPSSAAPRYLQYHLDLVQDEIFKKDPQLKELVTNTDNIAKLRTKRDIPDMKRYRHILEPFKEEFFATRDLHTELCLKANDIEEALSSKLVTVGWMVLGNVSPGKILLSQANLGSLLYLKSEKMENALYTLKKQGGDPDAILLLQNNHDNFMSMATRYYENVIAGAGRTEKAVIASRNVEPETLQAITLSLYGLGVIKLHRGNPMEAKMLLNEAKTMATEIGFQDLCFEADRELSRIREGV
ncbi:Rci50p KNAG_0A06210 [Huiozyma naganishii CBS 8797]|uniref:Mitochondrial inner membrane i-AAA protease supercomplex subunit MGR3 n=1 Tax=Huiozyma naganishii (strain ATCC MYA-139 / BCRC 22969 / CBS 8797 / KCTC 17520 / NBRC 10181 / NCYC 3082 / Yp74L-3) TaxID=1071383 RepID=J7RU04_HUIN7|nr:hypothetical protein KNAG_0A06210 [Kazachstania naganishii CBS 8797]CCK68282.1 hypothetical protein KNAG_0A06210 [Kazachstania naganishii CBS 8797]